MQGESFSILLNNQSLLNENTLSELKETTEKYPWFQLGWMLYLKNLKNLNSEQFNAELNKAAILVSNRKLLYNFLNTDQKEIKQLEETASVDPANDNLIDKFLETGPGKIRVQQPSEGTSPEELNQVIIQKSTYEDEELVSEMLAQIYVDQKNYKKAKSAYEKLSLKYPEKSVYFASRIQEIEKIKE